MLSRKKGCRVAARILVPGILSRPNHPPLAPTLDLGTVSPPELERAAGTTLDSTQADDAHAASSASMCAHLMIRQAIRERAAVGRLRLRLRHRSCATTSSFESASHKTRVTITENRAVPRALGSARWPASLLRVCAYRQFPIHSVIKTCTRAVLCVAFRLEVSPLLCRFSSLPAASAAGRKTDAYYLGYGAFRNDAPNSGVADDSQRPTARSRVDVRSLLAL